MSTVFKSLLFTLLACVAVTGVATAQVEQQIYLNNFTGGANAGTTPSGVTAAWSNTAIATSPGTAAHPADKFLGRFANHEVTLSLANLPTHTAVTVSFDLYVISSMDGNQVQSPRLNTIIGPDIWDLNITGGPTLLHTTFSNFNSTTIDDVLLNYPQSYPDTYPGTNNAPQTGAFEANTLGYTYKDLPFDSVYRLTFTVPHADGAITFKFSGSGMQDVSDESWGLDNVRVTAATPVVQQNTVQFSAATFQGSESAGSAVFTVSRSGDLSAAASVDFATVDSLASIRCDDTTSFPEVALAHCDYISKGGTITFQPGEAEKQLTVFITDDAYVEAAEKFNVKLADPVGAVLGTADTATAVIADNDLAAPTTNPIDDISFFVRQHYIDFFAREPDGPGLAFWSGEITSCGAVTGCVDRKRVNTSGAFFISTEFQSTGYFVYRLYRGALGRAPGYVEFIPEVARLTDGIVVNNQLSDSAIENNKTSYIARFVARQEFRGIYDPLDNQAYVDKLITNTGVAIADAEKNSLVAALNGNTETRESVLRKILDGTQTTDNGQLSFTTTYGEDYYKKEYNRAFVLMQYFGYLRRDPDPAGYEFWLNKLNTAGNFIDSEMVRSFLLSDEYRTRFGPK